MAGRLADHHRVGQGDCFPGGRRHWNPRRADLMEAGRCRCRCLILQGYFHFQREELDRYHQEEMIQVHWYLEADSKAVGWEELRLEGRPQGPSLAHHTRCR